MVIMDIIMDMLFNSQNTQAKIIMTQFILMITALT